MPVSPRRTAAADAWGLTDASGPRRGRLTWRPALAACLLRIAASTSWSGSATHCGGPAAGQPRRGDGTGGPVQGLCTCTCTGRHVTSPARATSPGQPCDAARSSLLRARERDRRWPHTQTQPASSVSTRDRQGEHACSLQPSVHRVRAAHAARRARAGMPPADIRAAPVLVLVNPDRFRAVRRTQQQHACGSIDVELLHAGCGSHAVFLCRPCASAN